MGVFDKFLNIMKLDDDDEYDEFDEYEDDDDEYEEEAPKRSLFKKKEKEYDYDLEDEIVKETSRAVSKPVPKISPINKRTNTEITIEITCSQVSLTGIFSVTISINDEIPIFVTLLQNKMVEIVSSYFVANLYAIFAVLLPSSAFFLSLKTFTLENAISDIEKNALNIIKTAIIGSVI